MILPPPKLEDLPAGYKLRAGLGEATVLPDLDFETYSEAGHVWDSEATKWRALPGASQGKKGLPVVGAAVYAKHPSTEILSLAYNLKDGKGKRHWKPGQLPPVDLFAHIAAGGLLEAHNSSFEHWIWNHVAVPKLGWPPLPQRQLRDTMPKARAFGLPGSLGDLSQVLRLVNGKDADGKRLLNLFSMPRNPTKADRRLRVRPEEVPDEAAKLYAYNLRDIEAESEASSRLPDLSPLELAYWQTDQRINYRGVAIDMEMVEACIDVIEQAQVRYNDELRVLTGGTVEAASELQKLKGWLGAFGVHADSLDEEALDELLARDNLPPHCRRALEIRQAVGSASVKKVYAMRNQASDGRLHDLYQFHGARTGRPTGQGPQPTNLPKAGPPTYRCGYKGRDVAYAGCGRYFGAHTRACPWCNVARPDLGKDKPEEWSPAAAEDAIEAIRTRSLELVEWFFGNAMQAMAGILRGLFIAKPGHTLISSDFTAVEGVVIACLAGEQWRIDAYANDAPMYLLSAERMYGVTVAEMLAYAEANGHHHPLRQKGKGGELGLGFSGWVNALRNFGVEGTDEELKDTILKWRAASPALVHFWGGQKKDWQPCMFGLEGMAVSAVLTPGHEFPVIRLDGTPTSISFICQAGTLYMRLPSGRHITYHEARVSPHRDAWRGLELSFSGWNSNPKKGPMGWIRMTLYGGLLAENATQAVARDLQMGAIERLEAAGYPVVMHTYDEDVSEVPIGFGSVEEYEAIMTDVDEWAKGWPIKAAGGWCAPRYRKG